MKKTIAALFTHSDDIEFTCAGTLAKHIRQGYEGYYVLMTRSNSGYQHLLDTRAADGRVEVHFMHSEEVAAIRRREAEAAAGELGATPVFLDFKEVLYTGKDGALICPDVRTMNFGTDEPAGRDVMEVAAARDDRINEVRDLLAKWEPEICITWDWLNPNPDHYCTFILAYRAFVRAARLARLGTLYAVTTGSVPPGLSPYFARRPDWFVDVSDPEVLDRCGKALSHQACQFPAGTDLYRHSWGAGRGRPGEFLGIGQDKRVESFTRLVSGDDVNELDINA